MKPGATESPAAFKISARRLTGRDFIVLTGLAILVAFAFWEVVAQGRVFFFRDFSLFFYPKRALATEAIRQFQIPCWESYGGCGEPVLGAYQSAIFYPPAIIYYLLPMPTSFMWFVVLHFFVSGAGAYYMMRSWGARRAAAAFAAFAWTFSPAFISTTDNVSFQTSLAWIPWCMAFAKRIYGGHGFSGFLLLAISFAMSILAGAPEPVVFIGAIIAAYALARAVGITIRRGWRHAWKPTLAIAGALIVAVLLSGVELAPFLYTLKYSARQRGILMEDAGNWSAKPSDVLLWFLPRFYLNADRGGIYWRSQFWLKTIYLGALVPLLALWTVFAVRRRRNWFFLAVAAVFVTLSFGNNTAVWIFLYNHLPGFGLIRFPVKFYLPAAFAIAVLAGFAVDDFQVLARRGNKRRIALLVATAAAIAVLFLGAYIASHVWQEKLFTAITPKGSLKEAYDIEQAVERYESAQWSLSRSGGLLLLGALALLAMAYIARRRIPRPYGGLLLAMALFADIGIFGAHLNPVAGPQIYTEPPQHAGLVPRGAANSRLYIMPRARENMTHAHLARINDLEGLINYIAVVRGTRMTDPTQLFAFLDRTSAPRFANLDEVDQWLKNVNSAQFVTDLEIEVAREDLFPNFELLFKVPEVESFEPLAPRWHDILLERIRSDCVILQRKQFLPYMLGASMIVDCQEEPPNFKYYPAVKPGSRAVLAAHYISVDSDHEAEEMVSSTPVDIIKSLVLFNADAKVAAAHLGPDAAKSVPSDEAAPGTAKILGDNGNVVTVEADARKNALLFLADSWWPLIRAKVDGKSAPVWRANFGYRAVPVPAGKHVVEFRYEPLDLYAGLAMTLLAVVALVVVARLWRRPAQA